MSALSKESNDLKSLIEYAIGIVSKVSGNVFTEQHHFLIETKIRKRMMDLDITDATEYFSYLRSNEKVENDYFVSELTTHYTFFFREFRHFEYLQLNLAKIINDVRSRGEKEIKILCLACSRGQEPYSLAMFFDFHLKQMGITDISFKIEGTDIDKASVKIATNGVYKFNDIKSIPMKYLADHWQRGKGEIAEYVKVKDSLRKRCSFRFGNIQKLHNELSGKYDIIFCRNVFIYFDENQIKKIGKDILDHLQPKGLFFTGVSESLTTLSLPIAVHGPSVYSHPEVVEAAPVEAVKVAKVEVEVLQQPSFKELPDPLKILCVDDSKIILSLMKKIFGGTPGYEVVGTAENGVEAEEFLKNNDVDIMTLDIHMPIMDGLTYLKKNFNQSHPPVVIVSSVSREDAFKAMEGLKFGASDYIEKPSLEDFMIKGDELCTKLRVAALEKLTGNSPIVFSQIDREFGSKEIENPADNFYAMYAHFTDKKKIYHILKEINTDKGWPATYLMLEGSYNILDSIIDEMKKDLPMLKIEKLSPESIQNKPNVVYIGDFKTNVEQVYKSNQSRKSSMIVLGHHSDLAGDLLRNLKVPNLLLDDVNFNHGNTSSKLQTLAVDTGPFTSFAYQVKHFIIKES
jgi:chemotaxis protein methyltransferase CheR